MTAKKSSSKRRRSGLVESKKTNPNVKTVSILAIIAIVVVISAVTIYITSNTNDNTAPIANEDYSVILKNSADNQIDVLANDIDKNGDSLNITDVTTPSHGSVNIDGSYVYYTPPNNFSGIDFIEYTIGDGSGESTTATIHVIVADENPIALIDTTRGTIVIELYEDKVPNTCENFIKFANDGFYDSLVFHRVIDNFMMQGGGFDTNGTQKQSPYGPINLEINNEVHHVDGAIAMARTSDPNSATSQFFIDDGAQPQLEPGGVDPNGYAVFGVVIDGIDVVRDIASVSTTTKNGMNNWPVNDVIINNITIENQ